MRIVNRRFFVAIEAQRVLRVDLFTLPRTARKDIGSVLVSTDLSLEVRPKGTGKHSAEMAFGCRNVPDGARRSRR